MAHMAFMKRWPRFRRAVSHGADEQTGTGARSGNDDRFGVDCLSRHRVRGFLARQSVRMVEKVAQIMQSDF
jgi:hypothetical protein